MVHLKHGRHIYVDATKYPERLPVADGVRIEKETFITIKDGEITNAQANDQILGIAKTSTTGNEDKKCSIVYLRLTDGVEIKRIGSTSGLVAGHYYTLADNKTIDTGSGSTTPVANMWNFLWSGESFVAHSVGF